MTLRRGPDRWWARVARPVLRAGPHLESVWGRVGRAGTLGLVADRPATLAVGMDTPALDGWTPTRIPGRGPPPRADWSRSSFVLPGQPARMDDYRRPAERASGHGVARGGRPSWCPLAPSSRPSKVSILDAGPGRCPSRCLALGSVACVPTASRAGKVQENRMSGRWRAAGWPLAPTPRPWPAIPGDLDGVLQALQKAPPEGPATAI